MPASRDEVESYLRTLIEEESQTRGLRAVADMTKALPAEAQEAYSRLVSGLEATGADVRSIEALVLPHLRPVYNVLNDTFDDPPSPWQDLTKHRPKIENAIRAVGRVEVFGFPGLPYGGTAFVVGKNLLLTNRHVAELFNQGVGDKKLAFFPGRRAAVDFKKEILPSPPALVKVKKVRLVHPFWDAAVLEVENLPETQPILALAGKEPSKLKNRMVAIIGYPAMDPRNDTGLQVTIFGGVFERKRLQPGRARGYEGVNSYGNMVDALTHDCSTLGGNSGSALVDVQTGEALGIHFAGLYLKNNYAVPSWQLALDSRVVDLGLNFSKTPAKGTAPAWLGVWSQLEGKKESAGPAAPVVVRTGEALAAPGDWYEQTTDERVAEALARDFEGTRAMLIEALGEEGGNRVAEDLAPPEQQEFLIPAPDPELPEIVLLHGIMGGHLLRPGFLGRRIWLSPAAMVAGDLSKHLTLAADGFSESSGGGALRPDGQIRMVYGGCARAWRKQRFIVHEFSFDWRKSIAHCADRLAVFIESRALDVPGKRFVLVAHSMGGLVSAMYAQRHAGWTDRIQRAVFLGAPLGGSYAPMEAVFGEYDTIRKLALISARNKVTDLQRMCATVPGLIDMLPDPSIFSDAGALYTQGVWPDGMAPAQRWLDQSRALKPALTGSPLLDRTTLLVSLGHGTVSSVVTRNGKVTGGPKNGIGDGTVPGKCAAIPGVPAFKVDKEHGTIPGDPKAIQAVVDLVKTGQCNLPAVQPKDLTGKIVGKESTMRVDPPQEMLEGMQTRFEQGKLRRKDLQWLMSTDGEM
jgi:pimeloyl-ACP methyl ester carboxylesterase/V8-like Glu-specific endopeptidase